MHKILTTALLILTTWLSYEVFLLKRELQIQNSNELQSLPMISAISEQLRTNQRNTAIAVLSAEAANNKIGAIAPYFGRDDSAFANAWIDNMAMPVAVFPDDVINELRQELKEYRKLTAAGETAKELFGITP